MKRWHKLGVVLCVISGWFALVGGGAGAAAADQKVNGDVKPGTSKTAEQKAKARERSKEGRVRYLKPMNAKPLPDEIRTYLQENGYLIPQHARSDSLSNVAQGRFFRRGQMDWAVLEHFNVEMLYIRTKKTSLRRLGV